MTFGGAIVVLVVWGASSFGLKTYTLGDQMLENIDLINMLSGLPFIFKKANIAAIPNINEDKRTNGINGIVNMKIAEMAPATPIYPNCFRVNGPTILSSVSINWGTWNWIIGECLSG